MGERPVCQKGGINVKENCSMKDGAALAHIIMKAEKHWSM